MRVSPLLTSRRARAFAAAALLLGTNSLALAAPPPGQMVTGALLSPAHSVHNQRAALNLSMPPIASPTALYRAQRLDEQWLGRARPDDWSVRAIGIGANEQGRSRVAFAIRWQDSPTDLVSPEIVNLVRNFRRNGLPIVHLWQSGRNLVAIGLNPHGKPGIYFTQQLPD
jgi:hypothetical protein